jgi:hypothetical protein
MYNAIELVQEKGMAEDDFDIDPDGAKIETNLKTSQEKALKKFLLARENKKTLAPEMHKLRSVSRPHSVQKIHLGGSLQQKRKLPIEHPKILNH